MPSKNIRKQYVANRYYHIYNRGVEKRVIFSDELDYSVFLSYLKTALVKEIGLETIDETILTAVTQRVRRLNLYENLELLAFCLLPNHFHLLVYQKTPFAIRDLMRSITTGYVMYFNKRHNRIGGLFQGPYKASLIDSEAYLLHISRYIHLNSLDVDQEPDRYQYSSYPNYVGLRQAPWVKPSRILSLYENNYEDFVLDYIDHKNSLNEIKHQLAD